MKHPKISAVLNNCPLHAITPELKEEVLKFGSIENYDNGYEEGYKQLKNTFAAFYEFEPKDFTWEKFAFILNAYNPFDTQILMGPVLRRFMKEKMKVNPMLQEMYPEVAEWEGHIEQCTEILANLGRYDSLRADELAAYVAQHLGFEIEVPERKKKPVPPLDTDYKKGIEAASRNSSEEEKEVQLDAPIIMTDYKKEMDVVNRAFFAEEKNEQPKKIQIYHEGGDGAEAGGHWERTENSEDRIDYEKPDHYPKLNKITPLLGMAQTSDEAVKAGMDLLKEHVQLTAQGSEHFEDLYGSARLIDSYITHRALHSQKEFMDAYRGPLPSAFKKFIGGDPRENEEIFLELFDGGEDSFSESEDKSEINNFEEEESWIFFMRKLRSLDEKIINLQTRSRTAITETNKQKINLAYDAAQKLHDDLFKAGTLYFSAPNEDNKLTFKESCRDAFQEAHLELDKHRDWSEFLVNLALGILTAGIGVFFKGLYNSYNERHFFFVHKTDSNKTLDRLEVSIVGETAPSA